MPRSFVFHAAVLAAACAVGATLQGVNVFYVPSPGFSGRDAFSLDVGYSKRRIVRAEVAVTVR